MQITEGGANWQRVENDIARITDAVMVRLTASARCRGCRCTSRSETPCAHCEGDCDCSIEQREIEQGEREDAND